MADVFVSYSRKDREFVHQLHDELMKLNRDTWVDWEDIPPTAKWLKEIYAGIESADTFVFVISPESVASKTCNEEIAHAVEHNKRIVPVMHRDVADKDVPQPLRPINWIFFRKTDDFDAKFQELLNALDTDLDWVKAHTRLLVRAIEWDNKERDDSLVLRGSDLQEAEKWLAQAASGKKNQPTSLQVEYIRASVESRKREEEEEEERQRRVAEAARAVKEAERKRKTVQTRAVLSVAGLVGFFFLVLIAALLYFWPVNTGWRKLSALNGLEQGLPLIVAADATNPDVLYASTQIAGGLFKSMDGGQHWIQIAASSLANRAVYAIAAAKRVVYATTQDDVFVSTDEGAQWTRKYLPSGSCSEQEPCVVTVNPLNPFHALIGARNKGLLETKDNGITWSETATREIFRGRIRGVTTDGRNQVIAAERDIWVLRDNAKTWEYLNINLPMTTTVSALAMIGTQGRFLIATEDAGIWDADVSSERRRSYEPEPPTPFVKALSVSGNAVYIGNERGLFCWQFWTITDIHWWEYRLGLNTPCSSN